MNIEVNNRQQSLRVNPHQTATLAAFMMDRARRLDPSLQWGDVSVCLTGDDDIAALNLAHLGRQEITDVLSFAYAPMPGETPPRMSGEVIVNAELAGRAAPHWGAARELALYLAHGCDHLMGEDDADDAGRRRMRRRELRWVREAKASGLLARLIDAA